MDRSDVITLLTVTHEQDDNGIWQETLSGRDVFCQVASVSMNEFFEAGRNGLNPEFQFTMFGGNYQGERLVRFHGQTYSVYRTYWDRNDTIELYVERTGGDNGKEPEPEPDPTPTPTPDPTPGEDDDG